MLFEREPELERALQLPDLSADLSLGDIETINAADLAAEDFKLTAKRSDKNAATAASSTLDDEFFSPMSSLSQQLKQTHVDSPPRPRILAFDAASPAPASVTAALKSSSSSIASNDASTKRLNLSGIGSLNSSGNSSMQQSGRTAELISFSAATRNVTPDRARVRAFPGLRQGDIGLDMQEVNPCILHLRSAHSLRSQPSRQGQKRGRVATPDSSCDSISLDSSPEHTKALSNANANGLSGKKVSCLAFSLRCL